MWQPKKRESMASQKTIDLGAQHLPVGSAAQQLRALADAAEATGYAFDTYGAGDGLNAFEAKVAAMLGKEAGLFVATGTMAQQSVLRAATWVHGLGSKPKVFVHGTSHLVHQDCLRDGADQAKKFARHAAVNLPDFALDSISLR